MGRVASNGGASIEHVIETNGLGLGASSEQFVRVAMACGYTVVATGPNRFRLARTYRPMWASIMALATAVFVGLGLFFLLVKRTEAGDAVIVEDRSGVRVRLTGALHPTFVERLGAGFARATTANAPAATGRHDAFVPTMASPVESTAWTPPSHRAETSPQPVLTLANGQSIVVGNGCVIGRNPEVDPQRPLQPVPVNDPSLSKTHVTCGPSSNGIWVVDHHSTNGTSVVADGRASPCPPGVRVDVPFGAWVIAGDVRLIVGSRL